MKIAMIGSGNVGLVSGACFADFGYQVVCIDNDVGKIESLNRGLIPIYEPGLDQLIATNQAAGRLSFTTGLASGIKNADIVFIASALRRDAETATQTYGMYTVRLVKSPPRLRAILYGDRH